MLVCGLWHVVALPRTPKLPCSNSAYHSGQGALKETRCVPRRIRMMSCVFYAGRTPGHGVSCLFIMFRFRREIIWNGAEPSTVVAARLSYWYDQGRLGRGRARTVPCANQPRYSRDHRRCATRFAALLYLLIRFSRSPSSCASLERPAARCDTLSAPAVARCGVLPSGTTIALSLATATKGNDRNLWRQSMPYPKMKTSGHSSAK